MNPSISIPDRLPVLPLPYPLVLHPNLLLSINISYAHSLSLLKAALQYSALKDGLESNNDATSPSRQGGRSRLDSNKPIIIACVPTMIAPKGTASADKPASRATNPALPSDSHARNLTSTEDHNTRIRINDLYDWGCAARLMRLVRNPQTQTCTLLVSGLTRVRVDRWLSIRAPLTATTIDPKSNLAIPDVPIPLATVTAFVDEESWPTFPEASPGDIDLVVRLKKASAELIEAISQLHPPTDASTHTPSPIIGPALPLLPASLLKKLRGFMQDCRESQAALLADIVVGTLGGACEWSDRVAILGDWDQRERVRHSVDLIHNGVKRVKLARELLTTLSSPLNPTNKENVIRSQLEALLNQLAALNQGVAARISAITSNTGDKDDAKSSGGIIIRAPASRNNTNNENGNGPIITGPLGGRRGGKPGIKGMPAGGLPGSNGGDDDEDEVAELAKKLEQARLSPEARKACDKELKRLSRIPQQSVERGVVITYLEIMAELPWEKISADIEPTRDPNDKALVLHDKSNAAAAAAPEPEEGIVDRARRILDADHYGLEKVKKRLIEYLAVLELKTNQARERFEAEEAAERSMTEERRKATPSASTDDAAAGDDDDAALTRSLEEGEDLVAREQGITKDEIEQEKRRRRNEKLRVGDKGPILLLVGPPGTGKTSIAKSLASALQRPFTRLSLGGVRDEAEIRGHRRTYVGAMPGSIVSSLRKVGVSDPVVLLDEVDKLGSGNGLHGDPMAAMLEVLDPEQNHTFSDHYINVPIDLSRVLFIATANSLDTISPPLLDRTEVIHISGYTHDEKTAIARQYLLPKQIKAQGLTPDQLVVSDDVLLKVAMGYTREAGVRTLEREIGALARAKAVEYSLSRKGTLRDEQGNAKEYDPVVREADLEKYLGPDTYEPEVAEANARPGVSTGLAYQGSGSGGILHIESLLLPPGSGYLKLTGSLGDVIRESAELALSWVKGNAFQLGIVHTRDSEFPKNDIHLHLPSGAIPKDGPSAGVAMTCALVSLFTKTAISPYLAMTGEVTLRGVVMPVGGIREKLTAASRAGIRKVLLPHRNRKDVEADLPQKVRDELEIKYVKTVWEAMEAAFGNRLFENAALSLEANGYGHEHEGIREGRRLMHEMEGSRL
ncbi:related to ATP-dependent protease La [Sporisorium reilianum SRZ2]|uniref:Lon protease homolog n=1 Tax=Sporisorium reilianum (strain SRZ2) TaxID=999809 RepID=E6ZRW4_SPORE|nr:related to ATP-dependent protease La [Sporisorium reilianum SRZ2]